MHIFSRLKDWFRKSRYYLPFLKTVYRLKNPGNVNTDEYQDKQSLVTLVNMLNPKIFELDHDRLKQVRILAWDNCEDLIDYSYMLLNYCATAKLEDRNGEYKLGNEVTLTCHEFVKVKILQGTRYHCKVDESFKLFRVAVESYSELTESYKTGTRVSRNVNLPRLYGIEKDIRQILRQLLDFQY